jgi:hypothetical protein
MAIKIPIITDFSDAGVKAAQKSLGALQDKAKSLGASLPAIGVAFAAIGGAATFLWKAVEAAAADQKSQALLADQLKKTLNANSLLISSMEKYVSTAQLMTGVSDTDLRDGLGTLVRATGDAKQAQDLLNLSMDISAATGKDLSSVTIALAKASNGNMTALQKLGVPLDQTALKTKDLTALTKSLKDQFGGAAATAANTFSGKIKILKGQLGEIVESIGSALLPYLDKFAGFLVKTVAPAVERINRVIGQHGLVAGFQQLVFESGKAGPAIINVVKGITIAFARLVNVVYSAVKLEQAQFDLIRGHFSDAWQELKDAKNGLIDIGALTSAFDKIAFGFNYAGTTALDLAASLDGLGTKVLPKLVDNASNLPPVLDTAAKAASDLKSKIEAARKELEDKFSKALDEAGKKLDDAKQKYKEFASSISSSITGNVSFSDVLSQGAESGKTFLAALKDQADATKQFAGKVKQLIVSGLSKQALQQVLDAGTAAGTKIADELIAGGADAISQANDLLQSVQDLADSIGIDAADKWYSAGVSNAQSYLDAITATISNYQQILKNPNLSLDQLLNMSDQFSTDETFAGITSNMGSGDLAVNPGIQDFMAQRQLGAAQQGTVINISGGLSTSSDIAQSVVDALRFYNQNVGPVRISTV